MGGLEVVLSDWWDRIVESTGARMFGLEESEVIERRRYVQHVGREIEVRLFTSLPEHQWAHS